MRPLSLNTHPTHSQYIPTLSLNTHPRSHSIHTHPHTLNTPTCPRKKVLARYARQFGGSDRAQQSALDTLAAATAGLSCRDIKETCEHAERRLASKLIVDR